ncbi:MAG: helix-turn-helix domain-containing protein [Candidatus Woesearchaeota archaeon]
MIKLKNEKIVLTNNEPGMNPSAEELAQVIMARIGLMPRKRGSTDRMHNILLELYERAKQAYRKKKPEIAVMTVEDMGDFAGISRQTMYDYLGRWTDIGLIIKTSFINQGRVIIGYKLNGNTLEQAFQKSISAIQDNLNTTQSLIKELQRSVKNEKIREKQGMNQVDRQEAEEHDTQNPRQEHSIEA